ncbi:MAG TPA: thiamine phosphate synthase [Polyangiaceae bacterium]|jgi:thiamine-phosphate pyrophosphorylase|nr:thiamine phosphate synthase [Polyangiaceae bacterium]
MAEAVLVPRLIVFSDTTRAERSLMLTRFAELGQRAVGGSVLFCLRDYELSARARWALARELSALTARCEQTFGVADRADIARAFECGGFHLPESGLSPADARRYLGPSVFLSQACHDPLESVAPELDARLLSPIFEERKGRAALGVAALERAAGADSGRSALFALGGVGATNAAACLTVRAAGVAVIGAALAPDPAPLLEALGILRV